jgi:hypothetical protein
MRAGRDPYVILPESLAAERDPQLGELLFSSTAMASSIPDSRCSTNLGVAQVVLLAVSHLYCELIKG